MAALTALMFVAAIAASGCGFWLEPWYPDYSDAEPCNAQRSDSRPEQRGLHFVRVGEEYVYGMTEVDVGCYVWEGEQTEAEPGSAEAWLGIDACPWPDSVGTGGTGATAGSASSGFSMSVDFDIYTCRIIFSKLKVH